MGGDSRPVSRRLVARLCAGRKGSCPTVVHLSTCRQDVYRGERALLETMVCEPFDESIAGGARGLGRGQGQGRGRDQTVNTLR